MNSINFISRQAQKQWTFFNFPRVFDGQELEVSDVKHAATQFWTTDMMFDTKILHKLKRVENFG